MEKKNVIFLSVIAVATLLTAVIGTTFAYFTAKFNVSNKENATSTVKTKTLVGTTVTLGDKIDPGDAIYPGFRGVQKIEVKVGKYHNKEDALKLIEACKKRYKDEKENK